MTHSFPTRRSSDLKPGRVGVRETRGPHELEARLVGRRLQVGEFDAQIGRDRARHPELVGEHVADQPRDIPWRPAGRQVPYREGPNVEDVGQDLTDLGRFIHRVPGRPKSLGAQQHAIGLDMQLDIPAYRLVRDRIERIVIDHVRSEEHTSELQSLMRISYAVFCLKKKKPKRTKHSYKDT